MKNSFWTILMLVAFMIGCLSSNLFACAMTAMVSNGPSMLSNQTAVLTAEVDWLETTGNGTNNNPNGWGAWFYHQYGYSGTPNHLYRTLQPDPNGTNPTWGAGDHWYRSPTNQNVASSGTIHSIATSSSTDSGKLFIAHARRASTGEPSGTYIPLIWRDSVTDTDYSFAHQGFVPKADMITQLPGFSEWLSSYDTAHNSTYATMSANHADSEYLFFWIIKNILMCDRDVKWGLSQALSEMKLNFPNNPTVTSQINIIFSDGNGVYAYSNNIDNGHKMRIKTDVSNNSRSYLVRSCHNDYNSTSFGESVVKGVLYYLPAQGEIEKTYDIDETVPGTFEVKNGYNWIGFPVLNTYDPQNPLCWEPDYVLRDINEHSVRIETQSDGTWSYYINDGWDENATLSRTKGYKYVTENLVLPIQYQTWGQETPYNTVLTLTQGDNWIPYFIQYSQTPSDAFGTNFSHVNSIYAQDWYIYKLKGK